VQNENAIAQFENHSPLPLKEQIVDLRNLKPPEVKTPNVQKIDNVSKVTEVPCLMDGFRSAAGFEA
jgi:hypothetical protein